MSTVIAAGHGARLRRRHAERRLAGRLARTVIGEASTPVTLTVVHDELEADQLCGLLRAEGIACMYKPTSTGGALGLGSSMAAPQEVLVEENDLDRARELLTPAE